MKNKILWMLFVLLFCSAGLVFAEGQALCVPGNVEGIKEQKNILILYYSKMGKTKILAEEVQKLCRLLNLRKLNAMRG